MPVRRLKTMLHQGRHHTALAVLLWCGVTAFIFGIIVNVIR